MTKRPVRQLSADVARKIAAGEVIDRPCAIIRELMDNAVDSGADVITVELENGGIDKIRITDNGSGMTKEDLMACARPHATSKISEADDLLKLTTLGFRGEALSSIAAVSRLTISSDTNRLNCSITEDHILTPIPPVQNGKGTIVMSEGLFENFPARRLFLKRPSSESMMCREMFIEKALPRTDISFRLTIDGFLRSDLPKDVSLAERFVRAMELKESPSLFNEITGKDPGGQDDWSFKLVIGEPSVYRNDRKQIFIYVNGRKVSEYSMVQAIEYGCQGFFPNGTHPVAALFITINPALVDFNIHPAKKEVRFKDSSSLHHGVSSGTRSFFKAYGIKQITQSTEQEDEDFSLEREFNFAAKNFSAVAQPQTSEKTSYPSSTAKTSSSLDRFKNYESNPYKEAAFTSQSSQSLANLALSSLSSEPETVDYVPMTDEQIEEDFSFVGTCLGTFILAQMKDTLYLIDQHAAHERFLFDSIIKNGGEKQTLLIPYEISTESTEDDEYINSIKDALNRSGFTFEMESEGKWIVTTIPVRWTGTQEELMQSVLETRTDPKDILYKIAAMTACKAAVKDGYILDRSAAEELAKAALKLPDPHCPHGRPVWTTLTREQLFARVRRTR